MNQQTKEISNSLESTVVGGSITAVAAFLGGLIGGEWGMATAGTAAAIIVSKYINRKKTSRFLLFIHFHFNFLTIVIQSQRSVLYCQSWI